MLKYGRHQLENYRLLQERQPEIGGALSCQRMLAFLFFLSCIFPRLISAAADWMSTILLHMVWP